MWRRRLFTGMLNIMRQAMCWENTAMGWALMEVPGVSGTYRELANGDAEVCQRSSDHAKLGSLKNAAWARHGGTRL